MSYNLDTTVAGNITLTSGNANNITLDTGAGPGGQITLNSDTTVISGDLTVSGSTFSTSTENILLAANYLLSNDGYTVAVAQTGGAVVRYLPLNGVGNVAVVIADGFKSVADSVSGVRATVATDVASGFSQFDIIAIDGANDEDNLGLYVCHSHSSNLLEVQLIGDTSHEDFTKEEFITDTTVGGTITQVGVTVMRAATDATWETGFGNVVPLTYTKVALTGIADNILVRGDMSTGIQGSGITVTDDAGNDISATTAGSSISLGSGAGTGSVGIATGAGARAINIGTGAASHAITIGNAVANTAVVINSGGSGDITIVSDDTLLLDADGILQLNSTAGAIDIGNDVVAQPINIGVGGSRVITIGSTTSNTSVAVTSGGTGGILIDSDDTLLLDSDGILQLNSSGGTIDVGNDGINQNINIGTGGVRTIQIGQATSTEVQVDAITIDLNAVAGGAHIDATATSNITTTGASSDIDISAGRTVDIDAVTSVTIDATSAGGSVTIQTGTGAVNITNSDASTSGLLRLQDNTGGQYVQIQTPATLAGNVDFVLPPNEGTAGFVLQTDGLGTSTWVAAAAGAGGSTGVLSGGLLTVGSPTSTYTVSDGTGAIFAPDTQVLTNVSWSGHTNVTPAAPAGILTFISIDSAGALVEDASDPTNSEIRDDIYLGVLIHVSLPTIDVTNDQQMTLLNPTNQIRDFMDAIGFINVSGNIMSFVPATTNLTCAKSVGSMLAFGSNFKNDIRNPHVITLPAHDTNIAQVGNLNVFQYRARDGSSGSLNQQAIDPSNLDDGTPAPGTSVTNNRWTVQRFYAFTSNNLKIQRGQFEYTSKENARAAINTEGFIVEPSIINNGLLIGFLAIQQGATDLSDLTEAEFYPAAKFGGVSSSSGGNDLEAAAAANTPPIYDTTGQIAYASSAAEVSNLAIGSAADILTVSGGIPSWATPSTSGIADNVLVRGDGGTTIQGSGITVTDDTANDISATTASNAISVGGTAGTGAVGLGTGAGARTISIGTSTATEIQTDSILVDMNVGTGGLIVDSTGVISLDSTSTGTSNITHTGAIGTELLVNTTAGRLVLQGGESAADAVVIEATHAGGGIDIDTGTAGLSLDLDFGGASSAQMIIRGSNNTVTDAVVEIHQSVDDAQLLEMFNAQGQVIFAFHQEDTGGSTNEPHFHIHESGGTEICQWYFDQFNFNPAGPVRMGHMTQTTDATLLVSSADDDTNLIELNTTLDATNGAEIHIHAGDRDPNAAVTATRGSLYIQGGAADVLWQNTNAGTAWTDISGGGGGSDFTINWESADFLNSTESGWSVTTLAPSIVDPLLNMVHVREFLTTSTSAVGLQFFIPTGTTTLTFTLVWRAATTNNNTVFWDIYARSIASGAAITADAWDTSELISHAATGGVVTVQKVSSAALTISSDWAGTLSAGQLAYFQLVRDTTDAFTGTAYVLSLSVVAA